MRLKEVKAELRSSCPVEMRLCGNSSEYGLAAVDGRCRTWLNFNEAGLCLPRIAPHADRFNSSHSRTIAFRRGLKGTLLAMSGRPSKENDRSTASYSTVPEIASASNMNALSNPPRTPSRNSPSKKQVQPIGITQAQKQALIDNLQLEST